jgi:ANTAR domain-containing protein/GAF domain-containing protein
VTSDVIVNGFVEFTDLLVDRIDEPANRERLGVLCAELLDVQAAGMLSLGEDGELTLSAASAPTAELLTRFEVVYREGPGVDAFRTGARVECVDLNAARLRWPKFAAVALSAGVAATYGLPCRLRAETVGALTLYMTTAGPLSAESVALGRGLANAVSLAVSAHRGRESAIRAEQLQGALRSRVAIEQAKGVLAERSNITVDQAFTILRAYARGTGTKMQDVARDLISGALTFPAGP